MPLYTQLWDFCKTVAPTWRKTQLTNLALLSQAIFHRRSLTLTELARSFPIPSLPRKVAQPKHGLLHRLKRLCRFLNNPRPDEEALMQHLTRLSYSVCRSPGVLLPLLLDLTYFEPFAVLSVAIPRGGRGLPIAWRAYLRNLEGEPELSQNAIIETVLTRAMENIATAIEKVIIADREFARAEFFRFLKRQSTHFTIRVDAETWVLHPNYTGPLGKMGLRPGGKRLWFVCAKYGKEEQEVINLLAVWAEGQEEAWFIASDLEDPTQVERLYRKRMKIEHGFRDWKHHLRLKGTVKVQSAKRLFRLVTGLTVLYWYVCLVGMRLKPTWYKGEVKCWGELGDFKFGMEFIELGHAAVIQVGIRITSWAAGKLFALSPPLPPYKLRYRRYRFLPQSG